MAKGGIAGRGIAAKRDAVSETFHGTRGTVGGGASDGKYFQWNDETELGVDVASGVDALLVIAFLAICSAPVDNIRNGAHGIFRGMAGI